MNIRAINPNEYPLLDDFLYDAIFIPEGVTPPLARAYGSCLSRIELVAHNQIGKSTNDKYKYP